MASRVTRTFVHIIYHMVSSAWWHEYRKVDKDKWSRSGAVETDEYRHISTNCPYLQAPKTPGFKPLEKCHLEGACKALNAYLSKYKLHQKFTLEEFEHWFLPRKDIVYAYVVEVTYISMHTSLTIFIVNESLTIGLPCHETLSVLMSRAPAVWFDHESCLRICKSINIYTYLITMDCVISLTFSVWRGRDNWLC